MFFAAILGLSLGLGAVEYNVDVDQLIGEVESDSITAVIAGLSGEAPVTIQGEEDSLPTRFAYSPGSYRAAQWLAEQLEAAGFSARLDTFQPPDLLSQRPLPLGTTEEELSRMLEDEVLESKQGLTFVNVVGTLPGEDSGQVLLTAHYDAISEMAATYTPGADDNASGVAGVLEAARLMASHDWEYTLRFVLFGAEELGLWGSEAYVREAVSRGEPIIAALNMDMIAYDGNQVPEIDIHCNPADPASQEMGQELSDLIQIYDLDLVPDIHIADATDRSDHYWFWLFGKPAALLIEDFNDFTPFYHTTDDRLSTLDIAYMKDAAKLGIAWAAARAGIIPEQTPVCDECLPADEATLTLKLSSQILKHNGWIEVSAPLSARLSIHDASGRTVNTTTVQGNKRLPLDLGELSPGVYWVRAQTENQVATRRFVLIR